MVDNKNLITLHYLLIQMCIFLISFATVIYFKTKALGMTANHCFYCYTDIIYNI